MMVLHCRRCGLPWARLTEGRLVVESRHHGEVHRNEVAVEELQKLCQAEKEPRTPMEQTPEQRQTEEEWIPVNVDGQQGVVSLDSLLEPPPGCVYSPEAREQLKEQIRRLGIIRITKSPDKSA